MSLRSKLIRLAHADPEMRPHLLPILKEARSELDKAGKEKQTQDILKSLRKLSHHKINPKVESDADGWTQISFNAPISMAAGYVEDHLDNQLGSNAPFTVSGAGSKVYIDVGVPER